MSGAEPRRADIEVGAFDWRNPTALSAHPIEDSLRRAQTAASERAVLLIHGWRMRVEDQPDSFDPLLRLIDRNHPPAADAVLTVSWPSRGDYHRVLPTTPAVAAALEALLRDPRRWFHRTREVVLVGHSMGCRVALELTQRLMAPAFAPEVRLFMMAAAVPVSAVEAAGHLHAGVRQAAHSKIYYSPSDEALGPVFTAAQILARDGGPWPEAVGLNGRPTDVWTTAPAHMEGYGHGRYWTSKAVAQDLADDHRRVATRQMPTQALAQRARATR